MEHKSEGPASQALGRRKGKRVMRKGDELFHADYLSHVNAARFRSSSGRRVWGLPGRHPGRPHDTQQRHACYVCLTPPGEPSPPLPPPPPAPQGNCRAGVAAAAGHTMVCDKVAAGKLKG